MHRNMYQRLPSLSLTRMRAAAGAATELPLGFKFDVLGLVVFFQQTMHALQRNEIFVCSEIAGLPLIDHPLRFGIVDFFFRDVDLKRRCAQCLAVGRAHL